jgi:spore maturation protein CgeB
MMPRPLRLVVMGLSITSSWGNGHATTYRALMKALGAFGHDVLFLERNVPWYEAHRDERSPAGCRVELYDELAELDVRFREQVRDADAVMVGSYVPDGPAVLDWVFATARGLRVFYDIDTPVTLARFEANEPTYLSRESIAKLDAYFSFSGGAALTRLEQEYGAKVAWPLYCSVDPEVYAPRTVPRTRDLGYLGTYCADRQPALDRLLTEPARSFKRGRFVVAGACYPPGEWPSNVERIEHIPPGLHSEFYCSQRFTLNVTRAHMVEVGHSPSVRLFEAAACGVPIIGDVWTGIDAFFEPGREILLAESAEQVLDYLTKMKEPERKAIGRRGRERVLEQHTARHRARRLELYLRELGIGGLAAHAPRSDRHASAFEADSTKMVGS